MMLRHHRDCSRQHAFGNCSENVAEALACDEIVTIGGEMIGDYDILIATTAIEATIPIITDNINHFNHVEGLTVETFRF